MSEEETKLLGKQVNLDHMNQFGRNDSVDQSRTDSGTRTRSKSLLIPNPIDEPAEAGETVIN